MEGKVKTLALCASVALLAWVVRAWTETWLTDFWGDSYHHWLITRLTMENGWVYSDYKGLEVVWSPLYHYVSAFVLLVSGRGDLAPLHAMNIAFGAGACALTAYLAMRLFANRLSGDTSARNTVIEGDSGLWRADVSGLTAGALLALTTCHIAFSTMNVTEVFAGLLVVGMSLAVLRNAPLVILFAVAVAMPLTRTDLSVYLGVSIVWLLILRRYSSAVALIAGGALAVGGWSLWAWFKTGNPLWWYLQYAHNNRFDWLLTVDPAQSPYLTFAAYMMHISPLVLPALTAGVLGALTYRDARRRGIWLVTALLAAHSLFLVIGYGNGIVPILTERYLALDLPLIAVLLSGWVGIIGEAGGGWGTRALEHWGIAARNHSVTPPPFHPFTLSPLHRVTVGISLAVALILVASARLQFRRDIPDLEIRRWDIDQEWQIGGFLSARVQPGEVVLTDAPVAIYRSGKPLNQFVSSVELARLGDPEAALAARNVRWIVTQPVSYDGAAAFIPKSLLIEQISGTAAGRRYELVWKYEPSRQAIQSEVWHVLKLEAENISSAQR